MSKRTITRLWIAGLVILVVGFIVGGVGLGLMFAYGGHFTAKSGGNGSDFVPNLDDVFWTTVGVAASGLAIALIGAIMQVAAWIGALVNTNRLQDKTWFIILLVGGLLGLSHGLLGFAAMVAYLVAGPDGTAETTGQRPGTPPSDQPWDLRPASNAPVG
jgi:hypothetical protein